MDKKFWKTFFVWRVWLFIPVLIAAITLSFRTDFFYTTPLQKDLNGTEAALTSWLNFDGVHYLHIAQRGYVDEARFLPAYPVVLATVAIPLQLLGDLEIAGWSLIVILTNSAMSLAALWSLWRLMQLDYSDLESRRVLLVLLSFPTAFFLVAGYSESLFLLLATLSFYWARKGKWWHCALALSLLSITRLSGIMLLPALLIEWWQQNGKNLRESFPSGIAQLLAITPLVGYAIYNLQKWGSMTYFITAHTELGNSRSVSHLITPVQTMVRYVKIIFALGPNVYEWYLAGLELIVAILVIVAVYLLYRQRVRLSYLVFSILSLSLPLFSGTFSGLPRYVLPIFPIYILLTLLPSRLFRVVLWTSLFLQAVLLGLFSRGYFVA